MQYSDFIKGKRVCFVGGCPNLMGTHYGIAIDTYDVIVKTNGSINLRSPEYLNGYGSRIDVLYVNNQYYRHKKREFNRLPKMGVRYLRMKACEASDMAWLRGFIDVAVIKAAMKKVNEKVGTALMGAYIIQDILDCGPKELHLCGIDFFISKKKEFEKGNYGEYLPGYLPPEIVEEGNRINMGKKKDGHDTYENTKFIYDLWNSSNVITMPDDVKRTMCEIVLLNRRQM